MLSAASFWKRSNFVGLSDLANLKKYRDQSRLERKKDDQTSCVHCYACIALLAEKAIARAAHGDMLTIGCPVTPSTMNMAVTATIATRPLTR